MATATRLLSIHPTQEAALASLAFSSPVGARVEQGVQGTTEARPWAVVAPKRAAEKGAA